ncbi:hypothetical protein AKG95_21730 [Janthinobacterium lividum]|uniref:Uncharacterized protein n=1 Tax=Janthinobacterium lividum TaxID=29581 RepID=A0A1S1U750_9BURK|nr:hypothetical protein [Janthinobacterium lividum]OHV94923.1 hypothetical protein AKG95_21730 [Janthinobacterium lividum]
MAQILLKQPGQPVADFSIIGTMITVAGVSIDCVERQNDGMVNVEIRHNAGGAGEGGNGAYLAQIAIPARRYETIKTKTGEQQAAVALDPNAIEVTLWPTV